MLLLLLSSVVIWPVTAQSPSSRYGIKMLHSDGQAILLELTVGDVKVERVTHGGEEYHQLLIPEMVQSSTPGEPQLPTHTTLLNLPSIEGVSVELLSAEYDTLPGRYNLQPAPQYQLIQGFDNMLGASSRDLARVGDINELMSTVMSDVSSMSGKPPVELGQVGYIRDQAVAQVAFYPVEYNPQSGKVRYTRRIRAKITWEGETETPATDGTDKMATPDRNSVAGETVNAAPRLKIGVTSDGLYQLTYNDLSNDLSNGGLDLSSVDPRTIKISHRGVEQPILVMGEQDGVFDDDDSIQFYGTAITNDIYTTENIYWLTVNGENGERMSTQESTPSGNATVPTHFPVTLHAETNNYYWQTMPNGQGQDHWFWEGRLTAPNSRLITVTLNHLSTTAPTTTVRVSLKGGTQSAMNPDHHSKIYLNERLADEAEWDDLAIYQHEGTLSHATLNEGENIIRIENVSDSETDESQLFVNWLEIDYWQRYVAQNDHLIFGAPEAGTFQFEVSGFTSEDVQLFDITDPTHPVRLINGRVVAVDRNKYTLQFEHTAQAETRYLAQTAAQQRSPNRIELDEPSSWKSKNHGADYIIITYDNFYSNTLPLANHRRASGLRVATVKVEDIYDEFNDGIFNPSAIRDFLSYAYHNWTAPAPTYVLLVGDAVQDYKDNAGRGSINYVPSQITYTDILGETPSDNWFVTVSGDDILPDMFIGRLSAQSKEQVDDIVNKIINYEKNPPTSAKSALFVADDEPIFEKTSQELAHLLPADYTTTQINAADYTSKEVKTELIDAINNGYELVHYTGHGSVSRWSDIFDVPDVKQLNNSPNLPVMTNANCLNGFFTGYQNRASLAESLQRQPEHAAIAVWAPANLHYTSAHRVLIGEFYNALRTENQTTLGAATTAAKIATYTQNSGWGELIETFVLFGDPAMPLGNSPQERHQLYLPISKQ